jgi:hypothetical protein
MVAWLTITEESNFSLSERRRNKQEGGPNAYARGTSRKSRLWHGTPVSRWRPAGAAVIRGITLHRLLHLSRQALYLGISQTRRKEVDFAGAFHPARLHLKAGAGPQINFNLGMHISTDFQGSVFGG